MAQKKDIYGEPGHKRSGSAPLRFVKNFSVSATSMRRFHLVMTVIWFLMMPLAIHFGWVASVVFISVISIYANFVGHFSAWQAARAEEEGNL